MKNKTRRLAGSILCALVAGGGEVYFYRRHNELMAQTCLFLGLLAIVVVDKVLELLGKDSEDVVTELQRLQDALGVGIIDPEAPRILEHIRGRPLHHYHLSKDKNGGATWFYQVVSFKGSPSAGKLTATASFVPTEGAAEKDHKYQIEASVESSHLVVKTRRVDRSPDIGIEVFRDAGRSTASLFPLYGVKILTTWWEDELASSISILSDVPLVRGAKDGAPLRDASGRMGETLTYCSTAAHSSRCNEPWTALETRRNNRAEMERK
jgi:hypothetical protein